MSNPHPHVGPETDDSTPSVSLLFVGAYRRLRTSPRAILALLLAGLVVTAVGWLRLHDPVPAIEYVGLLEGRISVLFGPPITVPSRATTSLSALVGLKLEWLAWAIGLELLGFLVVVGAGAYALVRLLRISLTKAAVGRYAALVALFTFGGTIHFEEPDLLLIVPLFVIWFYLLVRLFALPGLLVAGDSFSAALRRSWRLAKGHGLSLFVAIVLLGLLNHLAMSVPLVGPVGAAFVACLHAGAVATFLDHTTFDG